MWLFGQRLKNGCLLEREQKSIKSLVEKSGKLKGRHKFEDQTYSHIFLTRCICYLTDTGQRKATECFEGANEISGFTNRRKIFGRMYDCKLLKDTHKTISSLTLI
jgi:hypothetical protein